jgi:hypothetical protein
LAKESVSDNCSISENLVSVYEALQKNKIVTELELKVLELWLKNFTENS